MQTIRERVQAVQIRQQQQWLWQCASHGLLAGGSLGCLVAVVRVLAHGSFSWLWVLAVVLTPLMIGTGWAFARSMSLVAAARFIDHACNLKDRAQTALQFIETGESNALRQLQIADAEQHLNQVNPARLVPVTAPRSWAWGVLSSVAAILIAFLSTPAIPVMAAAEPNAVVVEQATIAAESLEQLKEFQKEEQDPELDRMLKDMNRQLTELSEAAVDPKEALAKLSEMESELQAMQQELADTNAEAQLKEVGEALSLAESMAMAGQALSSGEMDKAAAELAKMEMPDLDRKTEKAVTEKLEQAGEKAASAQKKQQAIQEAISQMNEGLSSGNREKFQEGTKGLAGECKKQGRRKKLSDLLKKQCQCLAECKSECEGECRNMAQGNKKGGEKAGKGTAGDPTNGEKTARQQTGQEMRLTAEDTGSGDADTETTTNPEQEQEAVRQYRQNAEKYEALSESALESESIPLGHRQTIRRYFELIRPQGAEVDAGSESSAPQ